MLCSKLMPPVLIFCPSDTSEDCDGPRCFHNIADTGIPALQQWCIHLTRAPRQQVTQKFLIGLLEVANEIHAYSIAASNVSPEDRILLQNKWSSDEGSTKAQPSGVATHLITVSLPLMF